MAKNTRKKAKEKVVEKEIKFTIQKAEFKNLLSKILKFNASYDYNNTLSGVNMVVDNNKFILAATDGNTLLKVTSTLEDTIEDKINVILSGIYLEKMKLNKYYLNSKRALAALEPIEITVKQNETLINDIANGIVYKIPHINAQYPKYDQLLPKNIMEDENYVKVGVNPALLSRLNVLASRGLPIVLAVNKNPNYAIYFESEYNDVNQVGLIMPCVFSKLGGKND